MLLEIEIKLRAAGVDEALERLARLPADLVEGRRFEDNAIFDTADRALSSRGSLLRLRVVGGRGVVTFKEKVASALRAKVRAEVETTVGSPEAMRTILGRIGLEPIYRYQKHRRYLAWAGAPSGELLKISLDETPIGVYMELEGHQDAIDRAAARMGYGPEDFILDDYRTLHLAWLGERGLAEGDMVFPEGGEAAR